MHFEVLVEDKSGSIALDQVLRKILGTDPSLHSWRMHAYRGIGRLPRNLHDVADKQRRHLLNQLPNLLRGYGNSLQEGSAVIVIVDVDRRDCVAFKQELLSVPNACNPRPTTLFRIAIEESEAWLLGDRQAVKAAYPNARDSVLNRYVQDSICDTWELLADAIHPGGSARLKQEGYPVTGEAKCEWACNIAPHMDVDQNKSKSFQVFRDGVKRLAGID